MDEFRTKRWFLNGVLHREDGPAIEWTSGTQYWYLNGRYVAASIPNNWHELVLLAQVEQIMND
jgi:hypothetical protein